MHTYIFSLICLHFSHFGFLGVFFFTFLIYCFVLVSFVFVCDVIGKRGTQILHSTFVPYLKRQMLNFCDTHHKLQLCAGSQSKRHQRNHQQKVNRKTHTERKKQQGMHQNSIRSSCLRLISGKMKKDNKVSFCLAKWRRNI